MKLLTVFTVSTLLSLYPSFSVRLPVKEPLPRSDYHTCCWEAVEQEVSHFVIQYQFWKCNAENEQKSGWRWVAARPLISPRETVELRSIQCTSCGPNIYHWTISQSHDSAIKNMPFYFQWNFLKTFSSSTQLCLMNFLVLLIWILVKRGSCF